MNDMTIVWRFLMKAFPDSHPIIYKHVTSPDTNVKSFSSSYCEEVLYKMVEKVFGPLVSKKTLESTVAQYLQMKKLQYKNGTITIKPLYNR